MKIKIPLPKGYKPNTPFIKLLREVQPYDGTAIIGRAKLYTVKANLKRNQWEAAMTLLESYCLCLGTQIIIIKEPEIWRNLDYSISETNKTFILEINLGDAK